MSPRHSTLIPSSVKLPLKLSLMEISSSKGLDTFTEEILNGKLDFLCSDILSNLLAIWILSRWGTLKSRSRIVQGGTE